jgi:hypothetical protein
MLLERRGGEMSTVPQDGKSDAQLKIEAAAEEARRQKILAKYEARFSEAVARRGSMYKWGAAVLLAPILLFVILDTGHHSSVVWIVFGVASTCSYFFLFHYERSVQEDIYEWNSLRTKTRESRGPATEELERRALHARMREMEAQYRASKAAEKNKENR